MFEVLLFVAIWVVLYLAFFHKKKQEFDHSKDSAYYLQEFPELLEDFEELPREKPSVVINITNHITNNHLNVYTTGEGIPHRPD